MADLQHAPASVADSASAEQTILRKELAAQKEGYVRLAADFDSFKKRTRRDSGQQVFRPAKVVVNDVG